MMNGMEWKRVSFAADCTGSDWWDEEAGSLCSICGEDYVECECPGPTMDGYEYKEIDGVMYGREKM